MKNTTKAWLFVASIVITIWLNVMGYVVGIRSDLLEVIQEGSIFTILVVGFGMIFIVAFHDLFYDTEIKKK
jgi:ABC-type multidrug transport system permease subunit